jgi:hypothetical protein
MRLHPEVTEEEAFTWLKERVVQDDPSIAKESDLDTALRTASKAMAAISRTVLPDDMEPMFP